MLVRLGFFAAAGVWDGYDGHPYGRLQPQSKGGKDSVTGHWEMMGIVADRPFPTYPAGFPDDLLRRFEAAIGRRVLGNRAASGTQIIAELGEEHVRTGKPILYTSADSVFQVACHEKVVPVDELYRFCEIAREICTAPHDVQRVIARPFEGEPGAFRRTERRKDYPLPPPPNLVDRIGDVVGIGVVPELFARRGFRDLPRTQSNAEHEEALLAALDSDARFIFANFEDFDMLYGHRNDPSGFGACLERFDRTLARVWDRLEPQDLLLLTADHGNDPTDPSTDHTREYVPLAGNAVPPGLEGGFAEVGRLVAEHLGTI
jgi:phosphopentomutase